MHRLYTTDSFPMHFFDWHAIARAISLSALSAACASKRRDNAITQHIDARFSRPTNNPMECPQFNKNLPVRRPESLLFRQHTSPWQ